MQNPNDDDSDANDERYHGKPKAHLFHPLVQYSFACCVETKCRCESKGPVLCTASLSCDDKLKHIGHAVLFSFVSEGQKGTRSGTFKEPTRANAQAVMPGRKSGSVKCESCLAGDGSAKS